MEETAVVETKGPSASDYFSMVVDGKPQPVASEPPAQEEVVVTLEVPAAAQTEEPVVQTGPITLDDEPIVVQPPADDFDSKYYERLNSDFGFDKDTIHQKLTATPTPVYKTEWAKLADEMEVGTKMSVADFSSYIATDFNKLAETNPIDVLDFKMKTDMPTMSAADRKLVLEEKYKMYEDATPQEKAIGQYNLNQDLKTALGEINAKKTSLVENLRQPEAPKVNQEFEQQKAFWKQEAPKVADSFKTLPVTLKISDPFDATKKEDLNLEISLSPKDIEATRAWVEASGASQGVKTQEEMVSIAKMMYWAQYGPKIVQKAIERRESMLNEAWAKKMANNTPPKGQHTTQKPAQDPKSASAYLQSIGVTL